MIPYTNDSVALAKLSTVFSTYLNGGISSVKARGLSATLPNGESIAWLSKGIQALVLDVALASVTGPISPITGIELRKLTLAFDSKATSYSPQANSSDVSATFALPFGFSLNIVELQNQLAIVENGTSIARLASPMGMAKTTLLTQNAGSTTGSLILDLPAAPLLIGNSYYEHLCVGSHISSSENSLATPFTGLSTNSTTT